MLVAEISELSEEEGDCSHSTFSTVFRSFSHQSKILLDDPRSSSDGVSGLVKGKFLWGSCSSPFIEVVVIPIVHRSSWGTAWWRPVSSMRTWVSFAASLIFASTSPNLVPWSFEEV